MSLLVGHIASRTIHEEQNEFWDWESDEALVVAARADGADFAALYQRYVDPIYRFCYRRLGDRAAAEDATSAVFERAIKALPRFKTGSFRAWLFTLARNTVTDAYRRDRGEQRLDASLAVADLRPGPEEISADAADAGWIRELLAHLNPDQRQIVEPRLADLTDAEIARVLGRSHGSVRTTQYRAVRRLRRTFGLDADDNRGRMEEHDYAPRTP
ncbi:MAG: RNA polymerase sigma factor [Thermomicrobiales bacterium]